MEVIQKLGESPVAAGYARVIMFVFPIVMTILGATITLGVNAVFDSEHNLAAAVTEIQKFLSGAEARAKQRDSRLDKLETNDVSIGTLINEHEHRITVLEQNALADHERRISILESALAARRK